MLSWAQGDSAGFPAGRPEEDRGDATFRGPRASTFNASEGFSMSIDDRPTREKASPEIAPLTTEILFEALTLSLGDLREDLENEIIRRFAAVEAKIQELSDQINERGLPNG
jgi:hypothetical protein